MPALWRGWLLRILDGETLSQAEAWDLLGRKSHGRVALSIGALPAILPVQYHVDEDRIALCVGNHDVPWQAVTGTVAAFSVVSAGSPFSPGWWVHVLGTLRPPERPGDPVDCGQPRPGEIVHMTPSVVDGKRLQLCPLLAE